MPDHAPLPDLSPWSLTAVRQRPDIVLATSPERSALRQVLEDDQGRLWVLERLFPGQADHRESMGCELARLAQRGLPVAAYLPTSEGSYTAGINGDHWQLAPFIPGDPLPRPEYVGHKERGTALGRFLVALHSVEDMTPPPGAPSGLASYCRGLVETIDRCDPDLAGAVRPHLTALDPLFEAWPELTRVPVQGDLHPLNVVWRGRGIAAVLDWEFMGVRPVLYDPANCLGCVGMEEPMGLVRGLAPELIRELILGGSLDAATLTLLPHAVLALRFAWLSEWLRKRDREMVDMELAFMDILRNGFADLARAWSGLL